jgi:large subunit ribosomal protein L7e
MEKYAVPNKLPSKQVTILAHRKRRIEAKQKELHKRHKKPKIVGSEGEKFRKPEFFVAEFRKAERDDKRIERAIMRHGISQKFMKDGELVFVMRHRG